MDKEDRACLVRIDERTATLVELFTKHVKENREDFKDVHHRVNVIAAKQNWMMGLGTACGALVGIVAVWLKNTFSGGS